MAEHTATLTKLKDDRDGRRKSATFEINITSAGADGFTLNGPKLGFSRLCEVKIQNTVENGGYVAQFIPTTLGLKEVSTGKIRVYEAGADGAVLDEVTSGDLGVFRFEATGY